VGAIQKLLSQTQALELDWPVPPDLDDTQLARLFYPDAYSCVSSRYQIPDRSAVNQELKHKGMTKQLLWEEYTQHYPNRCYSYPQFCERYSQWLKRKKRSLRQTHRSGEKCVIDYAGQTVPLLCADTGGIRQTQIYVALQGASSYTYDDSRSHIQYLAGEL
jgi:transposase